MLMVSVICLDCLECYGKIYQGQVTFHTCYSYTSYTITPNIKQRMQSFVIHLHITYGHRYFYFYWSQIGCLPGNITTNVNLLLRNLACIMHVRKGLLGQF